jgi:hypothetical protein
MSTKKTIQISPELFRMSGQKTKKNREKRDINIAPIISPNVLKNKLLKRIKDHKTRELKYGQNTNNNATTNSNTTTNNNSHAFSDEFNSAINYLSDITKKQKQQKIINSKTVKNYSNPIPIPENPYISLDLPPELAEPVNPYIPNEVFNVNYKSGEDIPYGCLKNGKKKTYREWKELTRPPELPEFVRPPTPPKKHVNVFLEGATPIEPKEPVLTQPGLSREQRLEQIKNKLKKLQSLETQNKMKTMEDLNRIEKDFEMNKTTNVELDELPDFDDTQMQSSTPDISELIENRQQKIEKETPKQYLKKTVKRKFTLGKSDKLRRVSILIKDKQTRKNIINTQKELKKTNITDVRKYLRQHGIIKVGSTCPPDILRKTFESALLAGEVTNTNKETLLHNFINDDSSK